MKRLFGLISALAMTTMIATPAFAHTHVTETNPADGATMTVAPIELALQFDGIVGEGSFIELTASNGDEIEIPSIEIGNKNMVASLAEPLANDEYKVKWSIISADGHPLQGSYTFTVNAPVEETQTTEQVATADHQKNEVEVVEEESNNTILMIALVLAVVIIGSLFALLKRRK